MTVPAKPDAAAGAAPYFPRDVDHAVLQKVNEWLASPLARWLALESGPGRGNSELLKHVADQFGPKAEAKPAERPVVIFIGPDSPARPPRLESFSPIAAALLAAAATDRKSLWRRLARTATTRSAWELALVRFIGVVLFVVLTAACIKLLTPDGKNPQSDPRTVIGLLAGLFAGSMIVAVPTFPEKVLRWFRNRMSGKSVDESELRTFNERLQSDPSNSLLGLHLRSHRLLFLVDDAYRLSGNDRRILRSLVKNSPSTRINAMIVTLETPDSLALQRGLSGAGERFPNVESVPPFDHAQLHAVAQMHGITDEPVHEDDPSLPAEHNIHHLFRKRAESLSERMLDLLIQAAHDDGNDRVRFGLFELIVFQALSGAESVTISDIRTFLDPSLNPPLYDLLARFGSKGLVGTPQEIAGRYEELGFFVRRDGTSLHMDSLASEALRLVLHEHYPEVLRPGVPAIAHLYWYRHWAEAKDSTPHAASWHLSRLLPMLRDSADSAKGVISVVLTLLSQGDPLGVLLSSADRLLADAWLPEARSRLSEAIEFISLPNAHARDTRRIVPLVWRLYWQNGSTALIDRALTALPALAMASTWQVNAALRTWLEGPLPDGEPLRDPDSPELTELLAFFFRARRETGFVCDALAKQEILLPERPVSITNRWAYWIFALRILGLSRRGLKTDVADETRALAVAMSDPRAQELEVRAPRLLTEAIAWRAGSESPREDAVAWAGTALQLAGAAHQKLALLEAETVLIFLVGDASSGWGPRQRHWTEAVRIAGEMRWAAWVSELRRVRWDAHKKKQPFAALDDINRLVEEVRTLAFPREVQADWTWTFFNLSPYLDPNLRFRFSEICERLAREFLRPFFVYLDLRSAKADLLAMAAQFRAIAGSFEGLEELDSQIAAILAGIKANDGVSEKSVALEVNRSLLAFRMIWYQRLGRLADARRATSELWRTMTPAHPAFRPTLGLILYFEELDRTLWEPWPTGDADWRCDADNPLLSLPGDWSWITASDVTSRLRFRFCQFLLHCGLDSAGQLWRINYLDHPFWQKLGLLAARYDFGDKLRLRIVQGLAATSKHLLNIGALDAAAALLRVLAKLDPSVKATLKEVEFALTTRYRKTARVSSSSDVVKLVSDLTGSWGIFASGHRPLQAEAARRGLTPQALQERKKLARAAVQESLQLVSRGQPPDIDRLTGLFEPPESLCVVVADVQNPDILLRAADKGLISAEPAQIGEWSSLLVTLARTYVRILSESIQGDDDHKVAHLVVGFLDLLRDVPGTTEQHRVQVAQ